VNSEFEIPKWVDWRDNQRLLESIGDTPSAEYEAPHCGNQEPRMVVAGLRQ